MSGSGRRGEPAPGTLQQSCTATAPRVPLLEGQTGLAQGDRGDRARSHMCLSRRDRAWLCRAPRWAAGGTGSPRARAEGPGTPRMFPPELGRLLSSLCPPRRQLAASNHTDSTAGWCRNHCQLGRVPASARLWLEGQGGDAQHKLGMLSTSWGCRAGRHWALASGLGMVEGVRQRMCILLQASTEMFPFLAHPSCCFPSSSTSLH